MNIESVLTHIIDAAEAPEAVLQIRELILDLAVRGRLAEREAADETAAMLLARIRESRNRLLGKTATRVEPLPAPFEVRAEWAWAPLADLCTKTGSGSTPRGGKEVYTSSGVPFLRSQNVYNDGLRLDDVAYIDEKTHQKMSGTHVLPGDLLLNITGGSIGRCCIVPDDLGPANISQHVAIIRPVMPELKQFLQLSIVSSYFQAFVFDKQTGAGRGGLPKNRMDRIPVAVAPLPEQVRIVRKVQDLLSGCDRLEAALHERDKARRRLIGALIDEALDEDGGNDDRATSPLRSQSARFHQA